MGEGDVNTGPDMSAVIHSQERLSEAIETLVTEGTGQVDAESRMRLRSIDVQMLRILEEISAGRQESMSELRSELAGLQRSLRQFGRTQGDGPKPVGRLRRKAPPDSPGGGQEG